MNILEVRDLKKVFNKKEVVKGVTFTVRKGEIFGFLGKNGAGKTTTINMLTGISNPSSGEFILCGKKSNQIEMIKKYIGVMPDASNFYNNVSAIDHLKFFLGLKKLNLSTNEMYNLLGKVGLEGAEKKKVEEFSFGMKKKLSIAQAMLGKPDIIFLDEPTSGLDPESALEIQQLMKEIQREGITIFLTSHNLKEVEELCSTIAIMKDGIVSKIGTIEQLRKESNKGKEIFVKVRELFAKEIDELKKLFAPFTKNIEFTERDIVLEVDYNMDTSFIVKILSEKKIDIYELKEKKVSLEDIFFEDTIIRAI
ncbi:ABC transporter ATP-binding protein [Bacillus sp. ZJS3]|uniref:ABC transporter ATP-binding protein n=1 Tax=Bacillus sp. ZJS3 TaxID=2928154 RepID=UPI001FB439F3|nr:ABC transporter ATP-binding protein [Bacillus sp. ZJS3]UOB79039.1 ABC transporter ATP-binding protein [Bacillus sp. ZJS3]